MTGEQSPGEVRRSISSDRVSVKWDVRASSEDDVALWWILAPPNDKRKRGRLEGWMKRHVSKARGAQRKLDHSLQEVMRLKNETQSGASKAKGDEKKERGN